MNSAYHLRLVHVHFSHHKSHHDSWWQTPAKIHIIACFYDLYFVPATSNVGIHCMKHPKPALPPKGRGERRIKNHRTPPLCDQNPFYLSTSFWTPLYNPTIFQPTWNWWTFLDVKHSWSENWQFLPRIAWARPHAQRIGLHAIGSTANKQRNDTVDVLTLHFKLGVSDIHWCFHPI